MKYNFKFAGLREWLRVRAETMGLRKSEHELRNAFETLPLQYQEALWLVFARGYPYKQAAFALKVPLGTLQTWIHRGKKEFVRQLAVIR